MGELIPWIDQHYRTVAARRGRAIAGLSMGGFGALGYASRHPGLFNHVAGFSPASDTNYAPFQALMETGTSDGDPTINTWGPYATQEVIWRGHNPWDLARNLRGMSVSLRYGNGKRGGPSGGGVPIEAGVHAMTVGYGANLTRLHIRHINDDYGPGGHPGRTGSATCGRNCPCLCATSGDPPRRPKCRLCGDRASLRDLRMARRREARGPRVQHAQQGDPARTPACRQRRRRGPDPSPIRARRAVRRTRSPGSRQAAGRAARASRCGRLWVHVPLGRRTPIRSTRSRPSSTGAPRSSPPGRGSPALRARRRRRAPLLALRLRTQGKITWSAFLVFDPAASPWY